MKIRSISFCLILAVLLMLSGCNLFSDRSDSLLQCPRPGGELNEIQEALSKSVSSNYTLKYAKSGEYRSAFVIKDLGADGVSQALVFYSVTKKKEDVLNMALAREVNKEWVILGSTALGGTDIEKLDFGDLDGDGILEVIVAWSIYGAPETRLSVFQLSGDIPVSIFEDSYTDFCVYDMDSNGCDDILLCSINSTSRSAVCNMLSFSESAPSKVSSVEMDKSMTSIRRFNKTELNGNPAVYIDAYSGSDTLFTEIISYHDGKLSAPLYEQSKQSHILTKRYKDIPCGSIDKDSLPEIPTMTPMPHSGQPENTLYLTEWKQYSKGKLETKEYSVISAGLQYKVVIDPSWLGYFSCEAVLKNGGTVFYEYSSESGLGKELFRLAQINREEYKSKNYEDWFTLYEDESSVIIGKISESSEKIKLSEKIIKNIFYKNITEE